MAAPPVPIGSQGAQVPPSPARCTPVPVLTQSWDGRAACLCDQEDGMPWPTTPRWAQHQAPMASPPGLEHQATHAPHTQGPAPAHTPARARAYTQDDGIFRPPALWWGLVAVDSPLGLGTGQSGSSASWWGREGSANPRACSCMRPPAQPNPTPRLLCRGTYYARGGGGERKASTVGLGPVAGQARTEAAAAIPPCRPSCEMDTHVPPHMPPAG